MPRYAVFVEEFISHLPELGQLETRKDSYWNVLGTNIERVTNETADRDQAGQYFSWLGAGGLRFLCQWCGLDISQNTDQMASSLGDYAVRNSASDHHQTLFRILDFLKYKRDHAVEEFSEVVLPEEIFELVQDSQIDQPSKRFCYALAAFSANPHNLQVLMLFESAERAGYTRYVLAPRTENSAGEPLDEESVAIAAAHVEAGAVIDDLDVGWMNDFLLGFEPRHGQRESLCYEVFRNGNTGEMLIFILRALRESSFARQRM